MLRTLSHWKSEHSSFAVGMTRGSGICSNSSSKGMFKPQNLEWSYTCLFCPRRNTLQLLDIQWLLKLHLSGGSVNQCVFLKQVFSLFVAGRVGDERARHLFPGFRGLNLGLVGHLRNGAVQFFLRCRVLSITCLKQSGPLASTNCTL